MKILIDIGHPAHVHLFKNAIGILEKKGHKILLTAKNKEHVVHLLENYHLDHVVIGQSQSSILGKIVWTGRFTMELLKVARKFKPDLFLSHGSVYNAFVSKLMAKPHICFEDTGNWEQIFLYLPFTDVILSPESLKANLGGKQIKFRGYLELAYLHPRYFNPDKGILDILNIKEGEKFVIIRFSAQAATHDFGHGGLPLKYKNRCVEEFSKYAKVFISPEENLDHSLEKFRIKISPEKIHDALYYATLVYSEGAKTASEASLLGTPAIYIACKGINYTIEQEIRYGTIFNFGNSKAEYKKSIQQGLKILNDPCVKEAWRAKREKIKKENIDLTAFFVWFLENYPESFEVVRKKPEYQFKFI